MRVRSSPFAGGQQGGGQPGGLTSAPMPPRPGAVVLPPTASIAVVPPASQRAGLAPPPSTNNNAGYEQSSQQPQMEQPQRQQPLQQQPSHQQQVMPPQPQAWHQAPLAPVQPQVPQIGSQQIVGAAAEAFGVNKAVAGMALTQIEAHIPGELAGATRWFPKAFFTIQGLFNVGHDFVLRKLLLLLCPFVKRKQAPAPAWGQNVSEQHTSADGADGLKSDIEEPDLYIPVMAYVTYVLVYGIQRGALGDFKPELLTSTASFALVILFLEVGAAKVAFYIAGSSVRVVDIFGHCGCKFVHVMLMVLLRIFTHSSYVYYPFFLYLSASAGFVTRRFMLRVQQSEIKEQYGQAPSSLHTNSILVLAGLQIPICWVLTPWSSK